MPLAALDFGKGKVFTVEEALARAAAGELDSCGYTYETLKALVEVQQDRGERISTTTLLTKCARQEFFKRKLPYTEEVSKLWAAFTGTMFHGQLEYCAHPDNVAEARYYVRLPNGDVVTGSPDLVSPHLGRLYDYKWTKEAPRNYPWPDHVAQVQVNRWLVDEAFQVEAEGHLYDLEDAQTSERFRPLPAREGGWDSLWLVYMDPKGPSPMKVTRSEQVPTVDGKGTKSARVADIWPDERVAELVVQLYAERKEELVGGKLPPIPKGFERQQHVLCNFCPVRDACWDNAMKGR